MLLNLKLFGASFSFWLRRSIHHYSPAAGQHFPLTSSLKYVTAKRSFKCQHQVSYDEGLFDCTLQYLMCLCVGGEFATAILLQIGAV